MSPAKTGAPHADPLGVHFLLRLQEGDSVADVVDLLQGNKAPLLPFAAAKTAVVKGEGHTPGLGKDLGVLRQNQFANAGKSMAEDDARSLLSATQVRGKKEVPFQPASLAVEMDNTFFHGKSSFWC